MTMQRLEVDRDALPTALLAPIKAHCRVEHTRDDALIRTYIAAAVGLIEHKCNVCLDPARYLCSPDELHVAAWPAGRSATLPVNNVRTCTITDDATPPVDISADFSVWNPDFGGNAASYLVAAEAGTALGPAYTLDLEVGVDDASDLAPGFFALIARLVGSLYENREASLALWSGTWDAELMAYWRPTA